MHWNDSQLAKVAPMAPPPRPVPANQRPPGSSVRTNQEMRSSLRSCDYDTEHDSGVDSVTSVASVDLTNPEAQYAAVMVHNKVNRKSFLHSHYDPRSHPALADVSLPPSWISSSCQKVQLTVQTEAGSLPAAKNSFLHSLLQMEQKPAEAWPPFPAAEVARAPASGRPDPAPLSASDGTQSGGSHVKSSQTAGSNGVATCVTRRNSFNRIHRNSKRHSFRRNNTAGLSSPEVLATIPDEAGRKKAPRQAFQAKSGGVTNRKNVRSPVPANKVAALASKFNMLMDSASASVIQPSTTKTLPGSQSMKWRVVPKTNAGIVERAKAPPPQNAAPAHPHAHNPDVKSWPHSGRQPEALVSPLSSGCVPEASGSQLRSSWPHSGSRLPDSPPSSKAGLKTGKEAEALKTEASRSATSLKDATKSIPATEMTGSGNTPPGTVKSIVKQAIRKFEKMEDLPDSGIVAVPPGASPVSPAPMPTLPAESTEVMDNFTPNLSFLWRNSNALLTGSYYEMGLPPPNTYDTIRSADCNRSSSSSGGYDEIQSPQDAEDRKASGYTYDELSFQRRPSDGYILPGHPESLSSSALGYERVLPPEEKPELSYEECRTTALPDTPAMLYDDIQGYTGYSGSNSYEPIYADLHIGSRASTLPPPQPVKELHVPDPGISSSKYFLSYTIDCSLHVVTQTFTRCL